ncbi:MAG: hypothetical protein ACYDH9_18700 [Limisphaerales bacterium]
MAAIYQALEEQSAGNRISSDADCVDVLTASAVLRRSARGRVHAERPTAVGIERLWRSAHSLQLILAAFRELGIDASSEDGVAGTTEEQFREKITQWQSQPQPQAANRLLAKLHALHQREIADFKQRLEAALTRRVSSIRLTVLRGHSVECSDIDGAIAYLIQEEKSYRLREDGEQREAFEVQVRFNTGAKIEATFPKRAEAIAFLRSFA